MDTIVRSAAGANIQTCELSGKPLVVAANSSLNQKFNVQPNTAVADNDVISMKYVTIGNMGHQMISVSGIPYPYPVPHQPRHAGLYNHIPFVLRLPTDDLTPQERTRYRLRRIEQHDGVSYVAYYAMVLDMSQTVPSLELRVVQDGQVTATPFSYTLSDLNPTPPVITPDSKITTGSDYIASTAKVPFALTAQDVIELKNVANIIYGDENLAIISELGLVHGTDRTVSADFNGVAGTYTEVIGAQITTYISTFFPVNFMNAGLSTTFDVGSSESLLVLS